MSLTAERTRLGGKLTASEFTHKQNHNEYWKLPPLGAHTVHSLKDRLEQRGYATACIKDYVWLRESLVRSLLGQTSYVPCTNDELRGFIKARGIDTIHVITKGAKGLRKELIQVLDEADQNPLFTKFLRLPPEIRNRIYNIHFADFTQPLNTPVQPPLTLTCSQIRAETLQMFYSACTFEITLEQHIAFNYIRSRNESRLHIPPKTLLWFHSLAPQNLAALRRLRFDFATPHAQHQQWWRGNPEFGHGCLGWFELEILRGEGKGEVRACIQEGPTQYRWLPVQVLKERVRRVVAGINGREGPVELRTEDLKALRRAMEV